MITLRIIFNYAELRIRLARLAVRWVFAGQVLRANTIY